MKKGLLLLGCISIFMCGSSVKLFAQTNVTQKYATKDAPVTDGSRMSPVEAFISRVKETNQFQTISNIWQPDLTFDKTQILQKVEDALPLTIDYAQVASLIQKNPTAISLVIPGLNGQTYTLDLAQYSYLSNDFSINNVAGEKETPFHYTPGKYYKGVVRGVKGSIVAFSFFNNEVFGIFSMPEIGNMVLVPNTMNSGHYADNQNYILYNDNDLKIKDQAPRCGLDKLPAVTRYDDGSTSRTTTTTNDKVYTNYCKEVRVDEVADYSMFVSEGSNSTNVTNYLTAVFNNEATIYLNEGVMIIMAHLDIHTATDPYQTLVIGTAGSTDYLDMFGDQTMNTFRTSYNCDMALLASTRDGSLGGVAWLQALCQNYAGTGSHFGSYAYCNIDVSTLRTFPTYSWDVEVMTHETGHVVGSPHTHACCWNPPGTGTTAIDACYTLEGSCATPSPAHPPGGGTIMSYCHLTSVGINFSLGFGQQPGDTIRYYMGHRPSSCLGTYNPSTALQIPSRTITANRECTDLTTNITYYWNDHNTADQGDDTLVLMIKKNGNTIGDLNTSGFSVTANTIVRYGAGTGDTLSFPASTSPSLMAQNYGMRRYWKITPTTAPTTAVEVIYPFMSTDTSDVHGSVSTASAPITNYLMYKVNSSTIDPNPYNGFPGASATDFTIYTYGTTASTSVWSLSTVGATKLAHMLTTNLVGGGTGLYTFCTPHPAPAMAALPTPPCPGTSATYSVASDPWAISYVWTIAGTGWSGTSTTNSITVTAGAAAGSITVQAVDTCGPGNGTTISVTPSPFASLGVSPVSSLCTTDLTADLTATTTSGAPITSYSWSVSGTGWSISGPSNVATVTLTAGTGTGIVSVTGDNSCGTGPVTTYNVNMTNTPPPAPTSITPPALVCPSSTNTFLAATVAGATSYSWTVAGTGWSGSSSTSSINVNIGTGPGTLTVNAANGCGTGPDFTNTFSTSTGPGAATSVTAPAAPCSGTSVTLSTPAVPTASSYSWVVTGTGWSGSSSTNSINVLVGTGTATVVVTPVNACGSGTPFMTTIIPTSAPTSTFAVTSHIVQVNTDVTAFYTGTAPAGSTFSWSFPGGVGSPGTGSGPQTVHWTVPGQYIVFLTVSNGSGCSSAYADTIHVVTANGITELNVQKINASIVPNPNNGTFDILFANAINEPLSVKMFDMQGKVVYSNDYADAAAKKVSVATDNLPSGIYTVTVYSNNEALVTKKITVFK